MTALIRYEAACQALDRATTVDEVLTVRAQVDHLRLYARQVKDRTLMAKAAVIQMDADRKLGTMLHDAEAAGLLRAGRPKKRTDENPADEVGFTLAEIGLSHKLSAKAQNLASISERAYAAMVERTRNRILGGAAIVIDNETRSETKQQQRAAKEKTLAGIIQALPKQKFGVILADPEWRFEPWSRRTGMDRAADNHYPTSATEVIAARDVPSIAADDCVLFLWATAPMLPHALCVMEAWGFDYKSHFIWAKNRMGTGYWNRNMHELLLIGTRGKPPAPAPGTQWASLIEASVGAHSAKPESFLELIEHYFPNLPKIELNRRGPSRKGWAAWGNEAEPGTYDSETGELNPEPDDPSPPPERQEEPAPPPASGAGSTLLASTAEDLEIPDFLKRGRDVPPMMVN